MYQTPLLANAPLEKVKRDVGINEKDATSGFNIKIKNMWREIYANNKQFGQVDNKYYFAVCGEEKIGILISLNIVID